jgi:hypothetical protein
LPWQRPLLAAAVAVHVLLVGSVITQPLDGGTPPTSRRFPTARLSYDAVNWPGPGGDFFALYHAGLQVRDGKSPHELTESPRVTPYYFRYIYSPLLAQTLGRLVSAAPPRSAYIAWAAVIELCLAAWLLLLWRSPLDASTKTAAITLLLVNQPYLLELHMGQFTFVAAGCALVAATLAAPGGTMGAGAALLAAATLIKTFPAATLPAFASERRARFIGLGGLAALTAIVWGSFSAAHGPVSLGAQDLVGVPHPGAYSIPQALFVLVLAVWNVWLPTAWPLVPGAITVLVVGVVGFIVWQRRPSVPVGAALLLLAFFVSYFHAWEHHYSAAILAGTALLLPGSGAIPVERRPLAVLLLAWLALPTLYALAPVNWTAGMWISLSFWKAVPLLALLMVGIRSTRPT